MQSASAVQSECHVQRRQVIAFAVDASLFFFISPAIYLFVTANARLADSDVFAVQF